MRNIFIYVMVTISYKLLTTVHYVQLSRLSNTFSLYDMYIYHMHTMYIQNNDLYGRLCIIGM